MKISKKIQWGLGIYLLIGSLFLMYDAYGKVKLGSMVFSSFMSMIHYLFATIVWYPLYFLQTIDVINGNIYWTTMNYITLIILGSYFFTHYVIIPITHMIHLKKKTRVFIIHILIIFSVMIVFLGGLPTADFNEKEILKHYNFKNWIYDYTQRAEKIDIEDGRFVGFPVEFETPKGNQTLNVYFVNEYYADNYDEESRSDGEKSFWGLAMYKSGNILINYEDINEFAFNGTSRRTEKLIKENITPEITGQELYDYEIEQTLIHELGHHLDNYDMLGDEDLVYFQNKSYVDKQYFIDLYDKYGEELGYYGRDVNFEIILFDGGYNDYSQSDWRAEIITRVNSVCFKLDPDKNYNEVKLQDYEYCNQFNFSPEVKKNYDYFIQRFVDSYVNTFVASYGDGNALNMDYRRTLIKETCDDRCSGKGYYDREYCLYECRQEVYNEILTSLGLENRSYEQDYGFR